MRVRTGISKASLLAASAVLFGVGGLQQVLAQEGAALRPGQDYRVINPAQPTSTEAGQVEVAEIFQYSCTHCFSFEPYLEQWQAEKADYVNFVRLPASWNPLAKLHAQAYYTAEILGKAEEMHAAFFREIHMERNLLDSEGALRNFFGRFGVDADTFDKTFNSFAVHTKVQRADDLIRRYRVAATPNIVVEGKYLTDGSMAGSYERWFDVIDALAEMEHEN
jgi:thiol:disulfide interchange protein DsbA